MSGLISEQKFDEFGFSIVESAFHNLFGSDNPLISSLLNADIPHPGEEGLFFEELSVWMLFVYWGMVGVALPPDAAPRVQDAMLRHGRGAIATSRANSREIRLTDGELTALIEARWQEYRELTTISDERGPIQLTMAVASHLSGGRPPDPRVVFPILISFNTTVKNVQPGIQQIWRQSSKDRVADQRLAASGTAQKRATPYDDDLRARQESLSERVPKDRSHLEWMSPAMRAAIGEPPGAQEDSTAEPTIEGLVELARADSAVPAEPDMVKSAVDEAIAGLRFLANRGGLQLHEEDEALLKRAVSPDTINWQGGMECDTPDSAITLREAIDCRLLSDAEALRATSILASAYRGFYDAAADGISLTPVDMWLDWYSTSLKENYPEAGASFLQFATTYWTFMILLSQLDGNSERIHIKRSTTLVRSVLARMDEFLGPIFFPILGPLALIKPAQREKDQRRLLEAFGPRINAVDFLTHNPYLIRDRRRIKKRWWSW
jgi:hypothetical protein